MSRGSTSLLGSSAGNIHELMPIKPTQLIDIFTPAYNETNTALSRWYQKLENPSEGAEADTLEVSFYSSI